MVEGGAISLNDYVSAGLENSAWCPTFQQD